MQSIDFTAIKCFFINILIYTDVTIHDYADNKNAVNRPKKNHTSNKVTPPDTEQDAAAVDDINIEDGDTAKLKSKRKSKSNDEPNDLNHNYADYHIDIWFLIAEHIEPSDVGRFAAICPKTAYVCQTAKFWNDIYRRYYYESAVIPERLRPDCMTRRNGLRACVIRSLFYVHRPFVRRLKTCAEQDFFALVKRECVVAWVTQEKDCWHFCFKLKRSIDSGSRMANAQPAHFKFGKVFTDIYHNPEESCKILVVKTMGFRPLPSLWGQRTFLSDVNHSLSKGFSDYKVKLTFCDATKNIVASVVYDPIVQIQVLDWWTPSYHSYLNT